MYHYLFTNDLRISGLASKMEETAKLFLTNSVPSATEDKSANNNANTLGYFFNLSNCGACANEAAKGNVRKVVINFINKFQFPNPRTKESLENCINDGIKLAPLRSIVKLLFVSKLVDGIDGFLLIDEIIEFVFFNDEVAKSSNVDYYKVYLDIKKYRESGGTVKPSSIAPLEQREWKQLDRQVKEMIKILTWSGFVDEDLDKKLVIHNSEDSNDHFKAELLDIIFEERFWDHYVTDFSQNRDLYANYLDEGVQVAANDDNDIPTDRNEDETELTEIVDQINKPLNRILFGAPGTGKSHKLEEDRKLFGNNFERVTFHPNYSYSQFVGTYKPKPKRNEKGEEYISYEFVPGPFLRVWIQAKLSNKTVNPSKHLLIIEEINRANVAAVFGDVFQLLDRKGDGTSEYAITPTEDMREYLINEWGFSADEVQEITIPNNMYLWSTMNSADQGVYPMDTAFKRRWSFEYIGIDEGEKELSGAMVKLNFEEKEVPWNTLRTAINNRLTESDLNVNEDKLIGPFFINENDLASDNFDSIFKSKLLMYLFEDVLKHRSGKFFAPGLNTYSKILKAYDEGQEIFDFSIKPTTSYQTSGFTANMLAADNPGEE